MAWAGHADEETTLKHYARPVQADPVVTFVKGPGLPLGEAWNVLYEMTWLVYGDPEVAPDNSVLTVDIAARFTSWLPQAAPGKDDRDTRRWPSAQRRRQGLRQWPCLQPSEGLRPQHLREPFYLRCIKTCLHQIVGHVGRCKPFVHGWKALADGGI